MLHRVKVALSFTLVLVMAILSGCGAAQPAPAPAPQGGATPAPAPTPAEKKPIKRVTIMQSTESFSYLPIYIARHLGYFAEEGVSVNVVVAGGGNTAVAAVVGGSAQLWSGGTAGFVRAVASGEKLVQVAALSDALTYSLIMSNKLIKETGVTPTSPLKDKIMALKGKVMGVTGAGSGTDSYSRYLVTLAGLAPDKDVKVVGVGSTGAQQASLSQGVIDAFIMSPPVPEQSAAKGDGQVMMVFPKEIQYTDPFANIGLFTTKEYLDANEDAIGALVRAIARASNYILDNPGETAKIMQEVYFRGEKMETVTLSVNGMLPGIRRNATTTSASFENMIKIHRTFEKEKDQFAANLDLKEGGFWTNKYTQGVK